VKVSGFAGAGKGSGVSGGGQGDRGSHTGVGADPLGRPAPTPVRAVQLAPGLHDLADAVHGTWELLRTLLRR
jgi:hypothetical protein